MAQPKKFVVGGLLNIGYGLATAGASYAQRQKALRQAAQLDQAEEGNIMSLAARRRVARQETDAQAALDQAARSTASTLAAAQEAGGSRAVQAISPSAARAQEEATARALQQFGAYGAQMSQQEDSDLINARRARLSEQRSGFQAAADAATQNMVSGLGMAAGGLAQTLGGLPKMGKKDKTSPDAITSQAPGTSKMGELAAGQMSDIRGALAKVPGVGTPFARPKVKIGTPSNENFVGEGIAMEEVDVMSKGGKAMKTPGKFSHESNPIDVIKDGKKIAEMTGGEYIFNPKQSETMRNLSKNGNSALHKFVRDLLSKRQFK